MDVSIIRNLVRHDKFELSSHAEKERQADKITMLELEAALAQCEVIEDYPNDPRGPSCLLLGFANDCPIHIVCALKESPQEVLLITNYDPSRNGQRNGQTSTANEGNENA